MVNGEVWLSDHDVVQVTPSQVPGVTIGPRCWVSVRLTIPPPPAPPSDSVHVIEFVVFDVTIVAPGAGEVNVAEGLIGGVMRRLPELAEAVPPAPFVSESV